MKGNNIYDNEMRDAEIDSLETRYTWFKDLEGEGLKFYTAGDKIVVFQGVITKGTIPPTDVMFECSIDGFTSEIGKDGNLSSAISACGINIEGGIYTNGSIQGCYVSGGTFTSNTHFVTCAFNMVSNNPPIFGLKKRNARNNFQFSFNDCYIDKLTASIVAVGNNIQINITESVIDEVIFFSNTMGSRTIGISDSVINKGSISTDATRDTVHLYTSTIYNFKTNNIDALFRDCIVHDSKLEKVLFEGSDTKIFGTTCTDCEMRDNDNPIPTMVFVNSSWDGGNFRGIFNYDSTWISGGWVAQDTHFAGAMVGWEESDGKYVGLPSDEEPTNSSVLFNLIPRIKKAVAHINEQTLNGNISWDTYDTFSKLCGVSEWTITLENELPFNSTKLRMMDGFTESEKKVIGRSLGSLATLVAINE